LSNAERASRLLPQDRTLIADIAEIKDAVSKRSR
jgi:hypothetical protein